MNKSIEKYANPINEQFEGSHFHHLHINGNHTLGVFVPASVHRSVKHDGLTGQNMRKINKKVLEWVSNQSVIKGEPYSPEAEPTIKVRFDGEIVNKLGKAGTLQDTYNTALLRVLLINEDVKRCLYGGEPETEELKKLKEMWCK